MNTKNEDIVLPTQIPMLNSENIITRKTQESLFIISLQLFKEKGNNCNIKHDHISSVYCISNSTDKLKYIGSTTRNINDRFIEHMDSFDLGTSKFYTHGKSTNSIYTSTLIDTIKTNIYYELELLEDYYIFKYDSINNGLNKKYNTKLGYIIVSNELTITEKIGKILNWFEYDFNEFVHYLENIDDVIKKIRSLYKNHELTIEPNAWLKSDDLTIYNPFLINNDNMSEDILDSSIYVIYGFHWEKYKKTSVHAISGGITNFMPHTKIHRCVNRLANKFIKYGFSDVKIITLEYIYANSLQIKKDTIRKRSIELGKRFKVYINEIMKNRYYLMQFAYTSDQIKYFISTCNNMQNINMYKSIPILKETKYMILTNRITLLKKYKQERYIIKLLELELETKKEKTDHIEMIKELESYDDSESVIIGSKLDFIIDHLKNIRKLEKMKVNEYYAYINNMKKYDREKEKLKKNKEKKGNKKI